MGRSCHPGREHADNDGPRGTGSGRQPRWVTKIAVPGRTAPRSGPQPPQTLVLSDGPLGLDEVVEDEPGGDQVAHVVAEGAVVLGVHRRPVRAGLHVGGAVEVGPVRRQPARRRVVREGPAHRVGHRPDPPPARPQHPGDLGVHPRGVRDEGDRPEGGERDIERGVGEGEVAGVGADRRHGHPGEGVELGGAPRASRRRRRWPPRPPRGRAATARTARPRSPPRARRSPRSCSSGPSRWASPSRTPSGHQQKSASPRNAPCSSRYSPDAELHQAALARAAAAPSTSWYPALTRGRSASLMPPVCGTHRGVRPGRGGRGTGGRARWGRRRGCRGRPGV